MNAEDCPYHRSEIDKTVFYPWICDCQPALVLFELDEDDD